MKIEVNTEAAAYHEEEIIIHARTEEVFHLLSSIQDWPRWQSNVSETKVFDTIRSGTRFEWNAGGLKIKSEIHTNSFPLEFGWTGKLLWIRATHNWYFYPTGQSTKVVVKESLEGFLAWLMKKSLAEGMKKNLSELKIEAERKT